MSVSPVDDAPTISAPLVLAMREEETLRTFELSIEDPDAGDDVVQVRLRAEEGSLSVELAEDASLFRIGGKLSKWALMASPMAASLNLVASSSNCAEVLPDAAVAALLRTR